MKRAVCYVRVSTEEQASGGVSLDAQRESLRAYCALRQLDIVELISDEGVSAGKSLHKRPGGGRLLELIKDKSVDAVVAYKLDRLFRKAAECLNVSEAWQNTGVDVHLVDLGGQAIDTSSAMGKFFLTIMAGVAEMERNLIRERTQIAMQHKIRANEFTGVAPFGYKPDAQNLYIEASVEEQSALSRMLELHTQGISIRRIATTLEAEGHVPRGARWHATTVARMIKRHSSV